MLTENLGIRKVVVRTENVPDRTNPPFPLHLWLDTQSPWYPSMPVQLLNVAALSPDEPWDNTQNRSFVDTPSARQATETLTCWES